MESLNTSPVTAAFGSVTDLISGASLSGLVGAVSPSPKVHVTGISVYIPGGSYTHVLTLYKGVPGGSDPATQVYEVSASGQLNADLSIILEAGEVLTAAPTTSYTGATPALAILVSADITF